MSEAARDMVDTVPVNAFMEALADVPVVAVTGESHIIYVSAEANMESVMDTLNKHNILSVPVVDASFHAVGFVDMLDIVEYVISAMKQTKSSVDTQEFAETLMSTPASSLVDFSRRNNYQFVSGAEDMAEITKTLSSGVIHRVCTGRKFGDAVMRDVPLSVCTQSDLIRFLSSEMNDEAKAKGDKLKKMGDVSLVDALRMVEKRNLVLLNSSATLLDACAQLIDESISVVGIVDIDTGRLVGAFSPSDFKNWKKEDFGYFTKPVLDFLRHKGSPNTNPLTVLPSISLGSTIHTLSNTKTHCAWIVNESYQPQELITLTDVLRIATTLEI
jgi:CBS domain-containing protein